MTTLTEKFHNSGFIVSEAEGKLSRDSGVITAQLLQTGAVLGRRYTGGTPAGVAAAFAGNTGNGAMGAITVSGSAIPGVYRLIVIEPGTNLGVFQVEDPNGKFVGRGTVGSAFSGGGLAFTLADGATDFVAGDGFNITVSGGSFKYVAFDPAASTGEQTPVAILIGNGGDTVDATAADRVAAILTRFAEVNSGELIWGGSVTTQQKTDALAVLALAGIVAR